ncbi:MAG TPA: M14 family zinc carboxypeptidase [Thermotogota bacterium]|nr:M14 family zinc carboxypeptidase [Thermotogota bacterium]HPJ87921.1 M14 family zinc carboxypeptidase [Thermotogota bacterium]HPR95014.1 M14 family zinc carboxypeptidase [Thermotogota bacterium]
MDFQYLIKDIPDYKRFYTVDEMDERSLKLAEKYGDVVECYQAGKSRKGHPIYVLKIGNGSKNALMFGCPHPNEPIGAMMLDFLSERLAKDEELRKRMDYTWYLIKVIDVDGTKLNEGWFNDSTSIRKYAQDFYRPPAHEQIEWTFPIDYKTLHFDSPLPETQVLMKLIEEKKPEFMFSLHNAGFGGVYYYITEDSPALYPIFEKLPALVNLPLSLGEPEAPYLEAMAPAVYELSSISQEYDYIEQNSDQDPATIIKAGTCSDEYAAKIAGTFTLVCEMPYYYDPRIEDLSDSEMTRKEARLKNIKRSQEMNSVLMAIFDEIEPEIIKKDSPFYSAVSHNLKMMIPYLKVEENEINTNRELERTAKVSEVFDNLLVSQFYQGLSLGMFRRLVDENLETGSEKIKAAKEKVDKMFDEHFDYLEKEFNYKTIPIKDLVTVQLLAGLNSADYIQKGKTF